MNPGIQLAFVLLAISPIRAHAQQPNCLIREVPASVTTRDGRSVSNLAAANFHAEFRGKPVTITDATYDTNPRRVIVVLDISGSMTGQMRIWRSVIAAARHVVKSLPPSDSVTVFPFATQPGIAIGGLGQRPQLLTALDQLEIFDWRHRKGSRRTALLDAIKAAADSLRPAQFGDSIVLITDGDDNASMENEAELERFLLASGIRVFGLVPGIWAKMSSITQISASSSSLVTRVSELTGGEQIPIDIGHEERVGNRMKGELSGFYRLKIALPEVVTKDRTWKLVATQQDSIPGKPQVQFPAHLARCP